jgi:hypothetical protein
MRIASYQATQFAKENDRQRIWRMSSDFGLVYGSIVESIVNHFKSLKIDDFLSVYNFGQEFCANGDEFDKLISDIKLAVSDGILKWLPGGYMDFGLIALA